MDWDPICSCQDAAGLELKKVTITPASDTTVANIVLQISETTVNLKLKTIMMANHWMIADVVDHDGKSLFQYLKKNLKAETDKTGKSNAFAAQKRNTKAIK